MAYFADLSPYCYHTFQPELDSNLLNVAWLDASVPFNRGQVDQDLIKKLLRLCAAPVNLCRGFHHCPYGPLDPPNVRCPYPIVASLDAVALRLGNGEIRVPGENGIRFAAPTLICHYIEKHMYRPPDQFLARSRVCEKN